MIANETALEVLKGGEFLIKQTSFHTVFTPEDITPEHKQFMDMTQEFINKEVVPKMEEIEIQAPGVTTSLIDKAGELGLLGAAIPEQYGGMGIDFNTETTITELLGATASFSVSLAAHTGIGTLPVLYYGTEAQRQKYLPKLASGEIKAAYCLTEPSSGSDAMGAKTTAVLSSDGTYYTVNGQKMWITNAGFANLFTVFVQIVTFDANGNITLDEKGKPIKKFTAFLIDAKSEGISLGAEEKKLGIKGSSTRQVFFENVKVPAENLLGTIGEGHKIAFNVLNIGRYKLGVMVGGGAKKAATYTIKYANERKQFDVPISSFSAIQAKLAEQAIKIFALESANYRTSDLIQEYILNAKANGIDAVNAKLEAAEEYAIECSILKVFGSEALDFVVDEGVQIHGGMGYSEEVLAARAYRDSRINRIFEGTNEINRMLAVGMLLKRALAGKIALFEAGMAIQKELMSVPSFDTPETDDIFYEDKKAIANAKKAVLATAGFAAMKFGKKIDREQEIMMGAADMIIDTYISESVLLRVEKMVSIKGEAACQVYIDMARTFISDALKRIRITGENTVNGFLEGDELRVLMMGLKRFTKYQNVNTILARRRIAAQLIEANQYCF